MSKKTFKLTGDKAMLKRMKRLQGMDLTKPLLDGAKIARREAKRLVPEDTGALRDAIKTRRGRKKRHVSSAELYIDPRVEKRGRHPADYAHIIEFGSRRQRPKPFLRQSFHNRRRSIFRGLRKATWRKVKSKLRGGL